MIYSINEGKQADDYKARKANERMQQEQKDKERLRKMTTQDSDPVGNKKANDNIKNNKFPTEGMSSDEKKDYHKKLRATFRAQTHVSKDLNRRGDKFNPNNLSHADAMRAAARDARRHPDKYKDPKGMFESVKFI